MDEKHPPPITPRIIIHGGAGNLTKQTLPPAKYAAYRLSLQRILSAATAQLSQKGASALDVATYAVSLLENDPLYNSGKGAVFTRAGTNELECSIMVSDGYRKRGVGCTLLRHVKNPIKLARELLVRGEHDGGDGAQDHCQYAGAFVEGLAERWGLEMVDEGYFFTQQRWDEHVRGLEEEAEKKQRVEEGDGLGEWERENYIPLGTCGAVVMDGYGTICAATSTGGLTNKVPGRVGDTPTLGAGFWAEEWFEEGGARAGAQARGLELVDHLSRGNVVSLLSECIPSLSWSGSGETQRGIDEPKLVRHAVGISGTGNGDSFLRTNACRTAAARSRFANTSLSEAVNWVVGIDGELQRSAGDRWKRTHEGTGGMIGIEVVNGKSTVVWDFNCGGMFRAWVDDDGEQRCLVFRGEYESGPETFDG